MDSVQSILNRPVGLCMSLTGTTSYTTLEAIRQSILSEGTYLGRSDQALRFLDLSAELRNMVYEYYIIDHPKRIWPDDVLRHLHRPYHDLGLSQVCKQVRAEYRSMCLTRIPKQISVLQFNKCLAAFHDKTKFVVADNIVLNIGDFSSRTLKVVEFDVLPLFERLAIGYDVACAFNITRDFDVAVHVLCRVLRRCAERTRDPVWFVAAGKLHSIIPRWEDKRVVVNVENKFKGEGLGCKTFKPDLVEDLGLRNGVSGVFSPDKFEAGRIEASVRGKSWRCT